MRISGWVAVARRGAEGYRHVVCEFCGAETLAAGAIAFCSNCESVVGSDARTLEGSNPVLFSSIALIRTAVLRKDFGIAAAAYDMLMKGRPSPQLLYARGIMCIEHSNHVVSQIRYGGGEGALERNSSLREKAAQLVSEGKTLIAKSLSMSEKEAREAPSAYAFYRMFLCALKLGNLRAAQVYSNRIAGLDREGEIARYAKIVMNVQGGLYSVAEKELEAAVRRGSPAANAFYYAAFTAFKAGDRRGAKRLLGVSGGLIEDQKRANLLEAIGEAGE